VVVFQKVAVRVAVCLAMNVSAVPEVQLGALRCKVICWYCTAAPGCQSAIICCGRLAIIFIAWLVGGQHCIFSVGQADQGGVGQETVCVCLLLFLFTKCCRQPFSLDQRFSTIQVTDALQEQRNQHGGGRWCIFPALYGK
jgi:hypothetical protein